MIYTKPLPSKEELEEKLMYEPETGFIYRWIKKHNHYIRADKLAPVRKKDRDGYRIRTVSFKHMLYPAHRLAMVLSGCYTPEELNGKLVDHINKNPQDNRINNLRIVNTIENSRNRILNTSRHNNLCGVRFHKRDKLFEVYFCGKYKKAFRDYFEACCFRKSWENKMGVDYEYR